MSKLTLHQKYAQAVTLYTSTERSLKDIADECGVSATALGAYLRRYRRELVLCRNGMEEDGCIKAAGRQTAPAHAKYKEAVAACDMMEYIDLNVSQVARKFRVDGTALANFMRTHYPDIPVRREALRPNWASTTTSGAGHARNVRNNMLERSSCTALPS